MVLFVSWILFQGIFLVFFPILMFFSRGEIGGWFLSQFILVNLTILDSEYRSVGPSTYVMLCMSWLQVCIQCILGLIIGCLGVAKVAGEFREIRAAAEMANK